MARSPDTVRKHIDVAAGVLIDGAGRVLVQQRSATAHQGGLWEFPGGKLHPGETAYAALVRELAEELGIEVLEAEPLTRVDHAYPDLTVTLDVWMVSSYAGRVEPVEGQPILWVDLPTLADKPMPPADGPIVDAIIERLGLAQA
ncbi:MAG: 8-oxo-dGTP diphosphatase MutT [Pseudomonadota bacterium]